MPDNGFSFTGMYMNDACHATNQIPQRAVAEGLICLYCPLDPTDGGSSERYSFSDQIRRDDRRPGRSTPMLISSGISCSCSTISTAS